MKPIKLSDKERKALTDILKEWVKPARHMITCKVAKIFQAHSEPLVCDCGAWDDNKQRAERLLDALNIESLVANKVEEVLNTYKSEVRRAVEERDAILIEHVTASIKGGHSYFGDFNEAANKAIKVKELLDM